jgi:GTP-binding protein
MPLKVAIVGRPNVGKSTLFNRLAGKKLAIVDDRPGVTRDRRYGSGRIGDLELELIDTAGFEDVDDESLESRMRIQTEKAVDEADVALFVVDAREGITPLDNIFAEILRKKDKPVLLAANKAEGKVGEMGASMRPIRLGLGEPIPISAEHGEGMADLYAALAAYRWIWPWSPTKTKTRQAGADRHRRTPQRRQVDPGQPPDRRGPPAGRPRGRASPATPSPSTGSGTAADPPGRHRRPAPQGRVQEKLEKLSTSDTIRAITFAEVVILVMDATHPFEIQDLQIADLVEREGRSLVFCLAKWDLVDNPQRELAEDHRRGRRAMLPQLRGAPIVALSAETGRGLDKLMPAVLQDLRRLVDQGEDASDLNDWLAMATADAIRPLRRRPRMKPKYMAQTKARPPTFVLFASRADQLPDSYRRYLVNSLRESFDLPGVPLRITVKANVGSDPNAEGAEGDRARTFKARREKPKAWPVARPTGNTPTPAAPSVVKLTAKAAAKAAAAKPERVVGKPGPKPLARPGAKPGAKPGKAGTKAGAKPKPLTKTGVRPRGKPKKDAGASKREARPRAKPKN